jgi:hypothetical protein
VSRLEYVFRVAHLRLINIPFPDQHQLSIWVIAVSKFNSTFRVARLKLIYISFLGQLHMVTTAFRLHIIFLLHISKLFNISCLGAHSLLPPTVSTSLVWRSSLVGNDFAYPSLIRPFRLLGLLSPLHLFVFSVIPLKQLFAGMT